MTTTAWTAAAMICRVLLMHVAADCGCEDTSKYLKCVDWLESNGYFAPKADLDKVRQIGNVANHELVVVDKDTAVAATDLVRHLLRTAYEMPGNHPK
jgi:hypothetical protein